MSKHLRLARLIELMTLIKYKPDWGPKKLAEYFEISEKRLYDDLNELNAAGIPIIYNGRGYSYLNPVEVPVKLTIEEILALWTHVKVMKKHSEDVYTPAIRSAAAKLLDMLPAETGRNLLELEGKVSVESPRGNPEADRILTTINRSLVDRKTLDVKYHSYSGGVVTRREVDPYGVIFRGNSWYLIGYCRLRKDYRTFRLNRIVEIAGTENSFQYPDGFSISDYVARSWAVFQGEETEVVVKFSKKLAPLIEEHRWRPDQRITRHKDGSITFRTSVRGILEIRRWIMSWGDGARVLEPDSLRKEIAAHAAALKKSHEK